MTTSKQRKWRRFIAEVFNVPERLLGKPTRYHEPLYEETFKALDNLPAMSVYKARMTDIALRFRVGL